MFAPVVDDVLAIAVFRRQAVAAMEGMVGAGAALVATIGAAMIVAAVVMAVRRTTSVIVVAIRRTAPIILAWWRTTVVATVLLRLGERQGTDGERQCENRGDDGFLVHCRTPCDMDSLKLAASSLPMRRDHTVDTLTSPFVPSSMYLNAT
jgi:hypothetical protein